MHLYILILTATNNNSIFKKKNLNPPGGHKYRNHAGWNGFVTSMLLKCGKNYKSPRRTFKLDETQNIG